MTPLDLLTEAQKLIRDPKHWTQGVYARNKDGNEVSSRNPDAVCFCSMGAIYVAAGEHLYEKPHLEAVRLLNTVIDIDAGIPRFNDTHTHEEVMELFDRARELAAA
ncbi:hypothetical protein IB276_33070 [Ensifer sp. ENS04]|uniref:DUF6197 family protein n=1 Tax=Ensifer sp. ENS04 TaxID=2769281 RepID=UPI00177AD482|nr:hypothetical protein [Ensifer sp. ENS04]MBD9544279.1 hypothetical protein [Ensifer sp. ENS04]